MPIYHAAELHRQSLNQRGSSGRYVLYDDLSSEDTHAAHARYPDCFRGWKHNLTMMRSFSGDRTPRGPDAAVMVFWLLLSMLANTSEIDQVFFWIRYFELQKPRESWDAEDLGDIPPRNGHENECSGKSFLI